MFYFFVQKTRTYLRKKPNFVKSCRKLRLQLLFEVCRNHLPARAKVTSKEGTLGSADMLNKFSQKEECMKINIFNEDSSCSNPNCYHLLNFDLTLNCHWSSCYKLCVRFYANCEESDRVLGSAAFIGVWR